MTMMQFATLDPMIVTAARAARTPAETTRLVKELNEAARKSRVEEEAAHVRRRKDGEELVAEGKRLSERGRARRAGSAAARATSPATANVFDFYTAREAARQRQLAAMSGGRR